MGGIELKRKNILIISIAIIAVFVVGYIGGSMYYKNRFLPNTTLGSLDISGDRITEANRKVAMDLHTKNITVSENGETLTQFTPAQIEANVDAVAMLEQAKEEQGSWGWPLALFQETQIALNGEAITYQESAMENLLQSLSLDDESRIQPQSASVKNVDGTFVVEPEVMGTTVDPALLKEQLLTSLVGDGEVKVEQAYLQPALTSDSEEIQAALTQLTDLASTKITYTIAGEEEVVPQEQIAQWLSVDETGNPIVDQVAAREYLRNLNDKYSTYEKIRSFQSTNRGTVEVPAGEYGWSIATEDEAANLASYILAGEDTKVRPTIVGSGYHDDGTDIGGSYVEVDLEAQIMYMYKNGEKVFESPIVAGHPQTPTPIGVFYAWDKVEDTELIGYNPRRDADYATPVDYWVPVNWTGIGIHDANWQGSFGSNEWKTDGSNGCINTPPGAMKEFFALLEIGMPVILF